MPSLVCSCTTGKLFGHSPIFVLGDLGGVLSKTTWAMGAAEIRKGETSGMSSNSKYLRSLRNGFLQLYLGHAKGYVIPKATSSQRFPSGYPKGRFGPKGREWSSTSAGAPRGSPFSSPV